MTNQPDFYRSLGTQYTDQLNDVIFGLSEQKSFIRPFESGPHRLRVMSVLSSIAVMDALNNNPEHAILDEMLGELPASQQIAVVPHAIKFIPVGKRLGKHRDIIEDEARAEGFKTNNGVRSISLELKPIKSDQFLPSEFKRAAQRLGATKFQDEPRDITLGWLDLATHSEEMTERRELIHDAVLQRLGVVLLDPIELGTL